MSQDYFKQLLFGLKMCDQHMQIPEILSECLIIKNFIKFQASGVAQNT